MRRLLPNPANGPLWLINDSFVAKFVEWGIAEGAVFPRVAAAFI
ncbi:MAG TPA: hypothetical protein VI362_06460 [Ignavibacteriaceae bacterium]|nr:hypothetical protein [Ignavibacteriaceae bacterium]